MTIKEVGRKLVELCRQNKHMEALETLYAEDIVSIEAFAPPGKSAEVRGLAAVKGKAEWWFANHEIHSGTTSHAMFNGPDQFAVIFHYDVTQKATGMRFNMDEVALYTVEDGKVSKEQFFYDMEGGK